MNLTELLVRHWLVAKQSHFKRRIEMKVFVVHTVSAPLGEGVVWAVCRKRETAEEIARRNLGAEVEEFVLDN